MKKMYRQGDLLFILNTNGIKFVETNPKETAILKSEVTGHTHKVNNGKIDRRTPTETRALLLGYIEADENCTITHEEHGAIPLPPGIYEVRRQREVTGFVYD